MSQSTSTSLLDVLIFDVERQRHGLLLADVVEVLPAFTIVPLPNAPRVIQGVLDLRGTLVPVIDVRQRFGMPAKRLEASDHFVITRATGRAIALRIDRASELRQVAGDLVEDARRAVAQTTYVAGVCKLPDGLVLLYDLAAFLSETEHGDLERAMEGIAP